MSDARDFWDARATEDAYFFVDSRVKYGSQEREQFWEGGLDSLDSLLDAVEVRVASDDRVLDIGCGVGRLTRLLAERALDVRGVDVSPRMLDLAREHNADLRNVEWIEGDGVSLAGVETESVDACVSFVVFQHIPDPNVTLGYVTEIGRVLRPGAWAAFQVSNNPEIHSYRIPPRDRLRAFLRRAPRGLDHPNWRGAAVTLAALRDAADAGGMDVERVVGEGEQFCLVRTRKRS